MVQTEQYTWIHVTNPNLKEIEELNEQHHFHEIVMEDLQERTDESKIDYIDNTLSLSLNFPKYNRATETYIINWITIIVKKWIIITISRFPSKTIQRLMEQVTEEANQQTKHQETHTIKKKEIITNTATDSDFETVFDMMYEIIDTMYNKTLKWLSISRREVMKLQETMTGAHTQTQSNIEQLLSKKINMIILQHIFSPQEEILDDLTKQAEEMFGKKDFKQQQMELYIDDLVSKRDKIIGTISLLYDTVDSLTWSYNALMTIKTNRKITVLTVFTAVLWVLTLVVGAYGMNIQLPLMTNPFAFSIVSAMMVLIAIIMILFFHKKWRFN